MKPETEYIITESRWLLSFGRPALDVASALNREPASLFKMAERHQLPDLMTAFRPYQKGMKA